MPLDAITRLSIKAFIKDLKVNYTQTTVSSIVALLRLLLREAVEDRRIPVDVSQHLRVITERIPERPWATPSQVHAIQNRVPHSTDQALILSAAYTGMRWAELTGLLRPNVHLDDGLLHIDPATGALHEVKGHLSLGPPKTPDSARTVTLPAFLINLLHTTLDNHDSDIVFCTPHGGHHRRSDFGRRTWRPGVDGDPRTPSAPIIKGMHFHDLRHTHKTWLIDDDIPEIAQSHRLGHHLPGSRGIYSHATPHANERILTALQARWETSIQTLVHT